jgi:hypothetical protein
LAAAGRRKKCAAKAPTGPKKRNYDRERTEDSEEVGIAPAAKPNALGFCSGEIPALTRAAWLVSMLSCAFETD